MDAETTTSRWWPAHINCWPMRHAVHTLRKDMAHGSAGNTGRRSLPAGILIARLAVTHEIELAQRPGRDIATLCRIGHCESGG